MENIKFNDRLATLTDDEIFELSELLADEVFGDIGYIYYAERQELTSKFNEIIIEKLHKNE